MTLSLSDVSRPGLGDKIYLRDGQKATVIRLGMGDFIGDPFPVYYVTSKAEFGHIMSDSLRVRYDRSRQRQL